MTVVWWFALFAFIFIVQVRWLDYVEHIHPTVKDWTYSFDPLKNNCTKDNDSMFWNCPRGIPMFGTSNLQHVFWENTRKEWLKTRDSMLQIAAILATIIAPIWVWISSKLDFLNTNLW